MKDRMIGRAFTTGRGALSAALLRAAVAASCMLAAPAGTLAAPLAAASLATDPILAVDPELRPAARRMQALMAKLPPPTEANVSVFRAGAGPEAPRLPDVPVAEHRIPGGAGAPEIMLYAINAAPGGARPGIFHIHGGGFVMGSARASVPVLQALARQLDCVIVTVEYRLSPETRFPGPVEDNYAGLRWMHGHAAELGLDPKRIALMGESAGGSLAALLALKARDSGEIPILFQMLIYPMLDDRTGSTRQVPPPMGQVLVNAESNRFGWRAFLGQEPGGANVPAAAVPARAESLRGLPPTFIGVGGVDLFAEEDVDYARRLIAAGVPTELLVVPGAFHGFDAFAWDTDVAKRFNRAKIEALKHAFAGAAKAE